LTPTRKLPVAATIGLMSGVVTWASATDWGVLMATAVVGYLRTLGGLWDTLWAWLLHQLRYPAPERHY